MSSEPAAPFGLDLSPELAEVRDWVHTFAEQVIRPAAAEWDEREETRGRPEDAARAPAHPEPAIVDLAWPRAAAGLRLPVTRGSPDRPG